VPVDLAQGAGKETLLKVRGAGEIDFHPPQRHKLDGLSPKLGLLSFVLYGGAKAADRNFAIVRCVDEEIIDWLARREMRRRGRPEMEIVTNDACPEPHSGIR
jgi:hypothetical protein